ncbi:ARS binding protein 2 [Penicillium canariense]|uniref:ARS binding protein 2 n=1 Tax=Penicillium canariense TaxID=189055 RepID=A0A9W9LNI1_9EURO|nr:ARS binding protein 2 [Penicillium canariense]KAJ5167697.1 ARS binding protein 2 [Penicillium canariense]
MTAEPRSAVTPSSGEKARARRRHGPAVSSAWPNSNGSITGKSRGRPPNTSSTSGSFSTFQVNPSRDSSQVLQPHITQSSPLVIDQDSSNVVVASSYDRSPTPANQGRPGKLQLQVPPHLGAPVRLATPPTLLVNGVNGAVVPQDQGPHDSQSAHKADSLSHGGPLAEQGMPTNDPKIPMEDIIPTMSNALLHARVTGQTSHITPDEARALASALAISLSTLYSHLPFQLPSFLLVFQLGIGHHFGLPVNSQHSITVNTEHATPNTAMVGLSGPVEPVGGTRYTVSFEYNPSCRLSLQVVLANFKTGTVPDGTFNQMIVPPPVSDPLDQNNDIPGFDPEEDDLGHSASDATWKQRYIRLRAQMQKKERALSQYKRKIVESVMADI